ncbi:MAG: LysM peptidoglycan-binding domain-containing protein, partial [Burkholderiaceae bacterium]
MRSLALALALSACISLRAQPLELSPDAPDRHVVVRGDTLWDIAGRFLSKPWRWPEIWQLNREQIRNPHLIYPGDVIILDRSGLEPRLRLARLVGSGGSGG